MFLPSYFICNQILLNHLLNYHNLCYITITNLTEKTLSPHMRNFFEYNLLIL
jgi:hypothetical protein